MNFGQCPYCDGGIFVEVPEKTPQIATLDCPECGKLVWYKMSRIDPMAWTDEDFRALYEVDDEAKTVRRIEAR